jgi:hypothetical protein
MTHFIPQSEGWARRSLDAISAALAAAWPGSAAVRVARRLASDEHAGRVCNAEILVDLPPERACAAASDLREAGFDVSDTGSLPDGFIVVRARLPLRAYHLHRLTTRLTRLIEPYAGIVVVVCALVHPAIHHGIAA